MFGLTPAEMCVLACLAGTIGCLSIIAYTAIKDIRRFNEVERKTDDAHDLLRCRYPDGSEDQFPLGVGAPMVADVARGGM